MSGLLHVQHLVKEYPTGRAVFGASGTLRAVDDVSFQIEAGELFCLVGESGSGKTTTGRCILRLIEPTSGSVHFDGTDLLRLSGRELREARRRFQIVFQDPYSSLNPRMRVGDILEEPLIIHRIGTRADRAVRVRELLDLVGLDAAHAKRYPREFSGGQRQRIGLARALALNPSLVVADEPVSALDVSVQAQVVNLLLDLRQRLGLTYLFIAHDLRLVRQIADRVAVMYRGRFVEVAPAAQLFAAPAHAYTKRLLSAMPQLVPGGRLPRIPFDEDAFRPLPLRPVGPDHLAAV